MKPETADLLDRARVLLEEASQIRAIDIFDQTGRVAYSAALQAARANIFELSGRVVKTHRGTHNTFFQATASEPRIDETLRLFLSRAYELKDIADYGAGPKRRVTQEDATAALETAARFVARIAEILEAS